MTTQLTCSGRILFIDGADGYRRRLSQLLMASGYEVAAARGCRDGEEVADRHIDVRLIAATQGDLSELLRTGRLRPDFYYRISAFPIELPALRERREDIWPLAASLLRQLAGELGRGDLCLADGVREVLGAYAWPGNIRELRNALERGVLQAHDGAAELARAAAPGRGAAKRVAAPATPSDGPGTRLTRSSRMSIMQSEHMSSMRSTPGAERTSP
ncbi:MAG: sigma 54-interacting transcriptional regulator [Candidatus Schekmanbacteria bacterium]|nr:sigma 54-interacting transcriptional regulator [Candidatus Schekmanbacteria bacterium]